jgi:hypothetical protein
MNIWLAARPAAWTVQALVHPVDVGSLHNAKNALRDLHEDGHRR